MADITILYALFTKRNIVFTKNVRRTFVDVHCVQSLGAKVNKNKYASPLFIQRSAPTEE